MISQEELAKHIKLITQNAWKVESNTTVNTICEYIIKESLLIVLSSLEEELALINKHIGTLYTSINHLSNTGEEDASTDGSIPQPKRNTETQDKGGRGRPKAGAHDGANGAQ